MAHAQNFDFFLCLGIYYVIWVHCYTQLFYNICSNPRVSASKLLPVAILTMTMMWQGYQWMETQEIAQNQILVG